MRRSLIPAVVLLATVVAVLAVPVGPVDTASAASGNCTTAGYMWTGASGALGTDTDYLICEGEVVSADDQSDAVSLYSAAVQTDSQNNGYFQFVDNYLTDTEQVAWLKAENAVAKAAKNGSTASAAKIDAKEALNGYYSVHEQNLFDRWNLLVAGFQGYSNQAQSVSGYDMWDESRSLTVAYGSGYDQGHTFQSLSTENVTLTLADGSNFTVRALNMTYTMELYDAQDGSLAATNTTSDLFTPNNADADVQHQWTYSGTTNTWTTSMNYLKLNAPSSDYDSRNYMSGNRMWRIGVDIEDQLSTGKNNTDTFVNGVYSDLEAGTVNASDIVSRTNKMFNYANQFKSDNATYNEGITALIAGGFSTPASVNTSYLNITYNPNFDPSRTISDQGMILSSETPGGAWEIGKTYNSSNITGTVFVHTIDGQERVVNGSFTIDAAYDDNGTLIEDPSISSPNRTYKATNTTETQNLLIQLGEDVSRLEELEESGSYTGGSGSTDGSGLDPIGWLANLFGLGRRELAVFGIALVGVLAVLSAVT